MIEGLRLDVGTGSAKHPVTVSARIGGRWYRVIAMSPLELIVGATSEITATGIKSRVRQKWGLEKKRRRPA